MLTQEIKDSLLEIGRSWGCNEVECWKDQHNGTMDGAPEWTAGNYCGDIHAQAGIDPADRDSDDEATRDAYDAAIKEAEAIIETGAREVWENAIEAGDDKEHPVKSIEFMSEHVHVLYADGDEECCLARNWNRCTAGEIDWENIPEATEPVKYFNGDYWETIGR